MAPDRLADRLPDECVDTLLKLVSRDSGLPLPRRRFQYNQQIVVEGQTGSSIYMLLRREVLVERRGTAIALLTGKGAFFGESLPYMREYSVQPQ